MSEIIAYIESHDYLIAPLILAVALLAAVVIDQITRGVMVGLTRKTKTVVDDVIIRAVRRPLFSTVLLVGAGLALHRLDLSGTAFYVIDALLISFVVFLWMVAAGRIAKAVLDALARRADEYKWIEPRTVKLFEIMMKALLYGGAIYGILLAWEVDVTAWLASAGIVGIAVGFAAKDTLANLFSGIFILADAPYKIGDFIILDSGERGRVTHVGVRTTRLLTRDDIQIILPNAAIANAKIVNETGGPHEMERVRVKVGVAYGSDIDKVREVLLDVAAKSAYLAREPEPRVRFREFGDSSLNFQLMGWINEPVLRGRALDELHTSVYKRFLQEEIEIPFPQRDVHLIQPSTNTD